MAITVVLTKSTPQRLVYLITGDGQGTSATIPNATLLADAQAGPLKGALNASYANQAAMQAVLGGGSVPMRVNVQTVGGAFAADVDVDGVTPAKPEINLVVPASVATAYLEVEHIYSPNA